ncbi:hypothetical protein [Qipengyuania sp. ASV99]|uniref:hypothetical protein n=1 Tax=Qipengyuania sp. ASV99 TaxID=3399681 RepID=UPI003A4C7850
MNKFFLATSALAPILLVGCNQGEIESGSDSDKSETAARTYPCPDRGGKSVEAVVAVGQEYFDFEQSKDANYFANTSPQNVARDFASQYCPANPSPGWFTGPVINGRGPDGKLAIRYYDEVTCQADLTTVPSPIPVSNANNGFQIYYSGCEFDRLGDPSEVDRVDTKTPTGTPTPI